VDADTLYPTNLEEHITGFIECIEEDPRTNRAGWDRRNTDLSGIHGGECISRDAVNGNTG
jgi:hypothetical protein